MKLKPITANEFWIDGGTMFGIIPKSIWSRNLDVDDHNRIRQHANCLLIELEDGRRGLLESGCGDPRLLNENIQKHFSLTQENWGLQDGLQKSGIAFEDLDFLIFTHLHWDHVGGICNGENLNFPNAEIYLHAKEWQLATSSDPLLHKSYENHLIDAIKKYPKEKIKLISEKSCEILPGISMHHSGGHTGGHASLFFEEAEFCGKTQVHHKGILFPGDVCPSHYHLPMVFQTSYDLYPLETRGWKQRWLDLALKENYLVAFGHDPDYHAVFLEEDKRGKLTVKQGF